MVIIDSIKRINQFISSVREVLPGRNYFIPETTEKYDPLNTDYDTFKTAVLSKKLPIGKALYTGLTGISPLLANEICCRASIDADDYTETINEAAGLHLFRNFERMMEQVKEAHFTPNIVLKEQLPIEFSSIELTCFKGSEIQAYSSVSVMLEAYYSTKNSLTRNLQKSADLRKVVANALDRAGKKFDLQVKQLKDTEKER